MLLYQLEFHKSWTFDVWGKQFSLAQAQCKRLLWHEFWDGGLQLDWVRRQPMLGILREQSKVYPSKYYCR